MPLQVKAVLESYVRVPALCSSACSAMLGFTGLPSPIFISTSTSPSLRLASPLSSPSHLLPSSFSSPQRRLPVLGSSGPAHSLRSLLVNPFFFLSLPTPRTVICHILERLLPIEKRSYSSRQACRILTGFLCPSESETLAASSRAWFCRASKGSTEAEASHSPTATLPSPSLPPPWPWALRAVNQLRTSHRRSLAGSAHTSELLLA